MPRYIAFLRGINVGGHRVKMDRLRSLFEELGLTNVSTFLASGNVAFSTDSTDAAELRESIESHLLRELGYEVATFLRSPTELAEIAARDLPEPATRKPAFASHYVIFLAARVPESLRLVLSRLNSETDHFHFSSTEIHWLIQGRLSDSPLSGPGLDRAMKGFRTTMRNMNTLQRIAVMTGPASAT
jgi:uncharacterized protein (DUF1697 family)